MPEKIIEFKVQIILKGGNHINVHNWKKIVARSTEPDTTNHGFPAIEQAMLEEGAYYSTWKIVKEKKGFIFREINTNGGISGHAKTVRQLIIKSLASHIKITLQP